MNCTKYAFPVSIFLREGGREEGREREGGKEGEDGEEGGI